MRLVWPKHINYVMHIDENRFDLLHLFVVGDVITVTVSRVNKTLTDSRNSAEVENICGHFHVMQRKTETTKNSTKTRHTFDR